MKGDDPSVHTYRKLKLVTDTALQVTIVQAFVLETLLRTGKSESEARTKLRAANPTKFIPSKADLTTKEAFQTFIARIAEEVYS